MFFFCCCSFKNCSRKGSSGNQKWWFYNIIAKRFPIGTFIFKSACRIISYFYKVLLLPVLQFTIYIPPVHTGYFISKPYWLLPAWVMIIWTFAGKETIETFWTLIEHSFSTSSWCTISIVVSGFKAHSLLQYADALSPSLSLCPHIVLISLVPLP